MNILRKRLEEIQNIPDEEIDTSDIPELGDRFWETAKMVVPISKKPFLCVLKTVHAETKSPNG
jgi:hypothetical protein